MVKNYMYRNQDKELKIVSQHSGWLSIHHLKEVHDEEEIEEEEEEENNELVDENDEDDD